MKTNIEGDYLWDKSGEPDPEIQQLEELLGTLRYQPRPLDIPAELQIAPQRNFFRGHAPGLAIAATITMLVLGLGLWLGLQRLQRHQPTDIVKTPSKPAATDQATTPSSSQAQDASSIRQNGSDQKHVAAPQRHRVSPSLLAGNTNRRRDAVRKGLVKDSALAESELQEAAAAKDQLMLGLRVASAKLSFAQKKMQESSTPAELIHNQHKIG